ncbi:MAG: ImmA/IrrE family metallo-endopeptidase [Firmicutes bacterium]|nr:ImmA/IrrE family metallo-endopeptidase [Bacillota bacterium]
MKPTELVREIESRLKDLGVMTKKARSSAEVIEYLKFMGHFHRYSFHNTLSIWLHCPHASQVAGYKTWQKLGRFVKKGERGIPILAPCIVKRTIVDEGGNEEEVAHTSFKVTYVFDVSQTDGKPLPEAPITASGDGRGLLPILEEIAKGKGIACEYRTLHGDHHGTSYGGRIEIDDRFDEAGKVSVITHELAHELLHRGPEGAGLTREQKEIEAEAVAFVVCSHFKIESSSANYLALWEIVPEKIVEAFQRVHRIAAEIIETVEAALTARTEKEGASR